MIRVVQTVEVDEKQITNLPDWRLGLGLLVFLDEKDINTEEYESFLVHPDSTVKVHRPDGTFIDRIAGGFSPLGLGSGWAFGLFLSDTKRHEVPVESEIELPAFCIPLFPSAE